MMKLEGVRFVFVSSVMKMKTKQPSKKEQFGNWMTFRGKRERFCLVMTFYMQKSKLFNFSH
jgi:hypothetical protein